jgi:hypothetical protein
MTLRDYFAAKALQRLIPDEGWIEGKIDPPACEATKQAYRIADAMLKERSK